MMFNQMDIQLRPELALGPNPLIECVPPYVQFPQLAKKLKSSPLKDVNWRPMPPTAREPLLEICSQHFVPTRLTLEPASGVQRLFRLGLSLRNPLQSSEQRRVIAAATATDMNQLDRLPRLDGAGALWSGPTGAGKTLLARRALEVFCPEQVIVHEACPQAGWRRLVQCCYLHVDQPSNGSRGGLLKRILMQLDDAIGTDYSDQYSRVTNIDTLLVTVSKLLVTHRVALLVIDEKQSRNFLESPWQLEFVLFYLSLMNQGISVLLLGNPAAFDHLKSYSQVMRRFSFGGVFDLMPATSSDPWWAADFVPGMREFNLVEKCSIKKETRDILEYEASAGLPGLYSAFHIEVQRIALRRDDKPAVLTPPDFAEAKDSARFRECLKIARSIRENDTEFADVAQRDAVAAGNATVRTPSRPVVDVVSSLLGRFKAEQTRQVNSLKKKLAALEGLSPEDLRNLGATEDMLAQLADQAPFVTVKSKRVTRR